MTADTNLSAILAELDAGATAGKWCQFHPSYTPEAVGTKLDWDISHQMSAVKDGNRKKLATWTHASDAHFAEVLVNTFRKGQLITLSDAEAMVGASFKDGATVATNTNLRDGDIDQMWLQSKACAAIRARGVRE